MRNIWSHQQQKAHFFGSCSGGSDSSNHLRKEVFDDLFFAGVALTVSQESTAESYEKGQ